MRAAKPRRRRSSSTANRSRRRKRAGLAASTRARKSRAASDISRWIHSACQSSAKSHPQVSKIEAQRAAYEASRITITVVKRTDTTVKGFIVLPKRWVVERTLGWINRARRLSKDFEATIESSLAWLHLALAFLLMRRIARKNEAV